MFQKTGLLVFAASPTRQPASGPKAAGLENTPPDGYLAGCVSLVMRYRMSYPSFRKTSLREKVLGAAVGKAMRSERNHN